MSKTEELLKAAFAGESQTNRRYLAFAAKADQEGFTQAARLFRAAAESETVHAHNYLKALKGLQSTRENLKEAISLESAAYKSRYPEMIKVAKDEGNKEAETFFRYALESERIHAQLFQRLMEDLNTSQQGPAYLICTGCGHTVEEAPPQSCPVCGGSSESYEKID